MSYGYDPKNRVEEGSWRETRIFVRAALEVILPLMGVFIALLLAVIVALWLLMIDVRLMVIPGAFIAAGLYWVWKRDKRRAAEDEAEIFRS